MRGITQKRVTLIVRGHAFGAGHGGDAVEFLQLAVGQDGKGRHFCAFRVWHVEVPTARAEGDVIHAFTHLLPRDQRAARETKDRDLPIGAADEEQSFCLIERDAAWACAPGRPAGHDGTGC